MKLSTLIFLLGLTLSCSGQTANKFNLNFEAYTPGDGLPEGWFQWGGGTTGIDTISHSGKYAGTIIGDDEQSAFGSIAYSLPASYEGKTITLEGYMKIQNVESGYAGLVMRIDGGGSTLAFENMQNQKINGTRDWQKYTITLPYPEDAEEIFVAGLLVGNGQAWFDDFSVTLDGKDIQTLKKIVKAIPKAKLDTAFDTGSTIKFPELTDPMIGNLELLGRVWGFLKYHHPEVGKGNYNWDYELFRVLPEYLKAGNAAERDRALVKWIEKYGKLAKCDACKETSPDAVLKPDLSWIESDALTPQLRTKLLAVYQNRHQGRHYYIKMVPNVGNPEFLNESLYAHMTYPDEGFRLLALYRFWNMIHYFFPYKHLTDSDWNTTLEKYIPRFILAKNELEYELAALELIGEVNDTHANLWGGGDKINEEKGGYYAPVHVRFIEGKLVVTDYYNPELKETAELTVGDVITHINNVSVEAIVDSVRKYYPASNDAARLRDIAADMLRSKNDHIHLQYVSGGQKRDKDLKLYPPDSLSMYRWYRRTQEKCYKLLDGNIGYVTLASIKNEDLPDIKETVKNTKGVIIDIRNYPSTFVVFTAGSYFVSSSKPFVKFTNGNVDNPGEFTFTDNLSITGTSDTYQGKLVVLVNELTQSQAEYTTMAFRAGDNTTVIGSLTAGADGNVSPITLPGGLHTMISGIGVYYPDGTETQRVGIVPDIVVEPTIEGIKNGRDELLEKAIEVINR